MNKKIDKNRLPWFLKLILRIPVANSLETASGIFWAIVVPIFLVLNFFFSMFLLLWFPFPLNIILTAIIPVVVFVIFVRITLERFINWWNLTVSEPYFVWNIDKGVKEYLDLVNKKEKKSE